MEDFRTIIRDNIRRLMAQRGMNQAQLCDKINMTTPNLSRILNFRTPLMEDHIIRIAKALNVSPNELFKNVYPERQFQIEKPVIKKEIDAGISELIDKLERMKPQDAHNIIKAILRLVDSLHN